MKLHLGENIRENRRRMGLTQEQLADRLGVSFQSVSRWENGTTYPDMEKLPEIARLFDTTVDDLLGYTSECSKDSATYEETADRLRKAYLRHDWNECVKLIRLVRREYFESFDRLPGEFISAICVRGTRGFHFTPSREVIEELGKLLESVFEKAKNPSVRSILVQQIAEIADDESFNHLVHRYAAMNENTTMEGLYLHRYGVRNEAEKYENLRITKKFRQLRSFFLDNSDRVRPQPVDSEVLRREYSARLGMLHGLCMTEPDEKHPVSGDGTVDFLAELRIMTGIGYADSLCGCGDTDSALMVIEDIADMIEQLGEMKRGDVLPCKAPEYDGLIIIKQKGINVTLPNGKNYVSFEFYPDFTGRGFAVNCPCLIEVSAYLEMLDGYCFYSDPMKGWGRGIEIRLPHFETLRDNPRFIGAVERIKAYCEKDDE